MSPVPFCCFGCLFCLHFRKIPYWNWIRLSGRVHLYSHLLMSNLQARMLTYMGTLMYLITGIYNVFVSHISSLYIYVYYLYINIFLKDIYYICLYYIFVSKNPNVYIYIYISITTISVELIPWVIEVGLFSLGNAGGILRPSSVICTETCYDGALRSIDGLENTFWGFHSLQGSLPRKGSQSCTCVYLYLYLHTGIAKLKHDSLSFCNCTRTERYAHTCPEPYR